MIDFSALLHNGFFNFNKIPDMSLLTDFRTCAQSGKGTNCSAGRHVRLLKMTKGLDSNVVADLDARTKNDVRPQR